MIKRSVTKEGTAKPPKWMCVYNRSTGFRVVSLNREISHPDIAAYNVLFDDSKHEILVRKPIDINSIEKDSLVAVANFVEKNPELKAKVQEIDPSFLQKANVIKQEQQRNKLKLLRFEEARQRQ